MNSITRGFLMLVSILAIGATQFAHGEDLSAGKGCAIAGPENAQVTIEEFVDFQCPYCVKANSTLREVLQEFPGQVRVVLRNRPLPFHNHAMIAAKAAAAICLQSPNLVGKFKDEVFQQQERLKTEGEKFLIEVGGKIGANTSTMEADMHSEAVKKIIQLDQTRADELNVKGTPSLLIDKELVVGARSYSELKRILEAKLTP